MLLEPQMGSVSLGTILGTVLFGYHFFSVISLIHPENRASIRVAERLGEKPEGSTEVLGIPVIIYGVDRPANVTAA